MQAFILFNLFDAPKYGKELRGKLENMSLPSFYQLMGRLEKDGYVKGVREVRVEKKQVFKNTKYRLTEKGKIAVSNLSKFYRCLIHSENL